MAFLPLQVVAVAVAVERQFGTAFVFDAEGDFPGGERDAEDAAPPVCFGGVVDVVFGDGYRGGAVQAVGFLHARGDFVAPFGAEAFVGFGGLHGVADGGDFGVGGLAWCSATSGKQGGKEGGAAGGLHGLFLMG